MVGDKMSNRIEEYQKVHKENYIKVIQELIKNNTSAFIHDDMFPLFDKPPLDSMDMIRNKLLSLAKEYKVVLQTENLIKMMDHYQKAMKEEIKIIGKYREKNLLQYLNNFIAGREQNIKILKKDLVILDKQIQKSFKEILQKNCQFYLIEKIDSLFNSRDQAKMEEILKKMKDFLNKKYLKQLLDSLDIKMLVKDTTLLNGIKEQTNRYLFTLENSHLFD